MQTENIAIKESENGKVIASDHELFVKKIATKPQISQKNIRIVSNFFIKNLAR